MANPKLRVRASGLGGSGYILPARVGDPFKIVKNADGDPIKARLDSEGKTTVVGGTTTILKQHEKDNLIQWAVNLTVKWASDNAALLLSKSDAEVARWGKYRHQDVRDERAEIGTHIHEFIDAELNNEWVLPDLTDEEASAVNQWHRFTNEHEVGEGFTEVTLWGDGYAGTADWLGKIDGLMTLADWKGLALDTPIPTVTGWTTMGGLQVGQQVFDKDGAVCTVTAKSEVHHTPTFVIRFDDGSEVIADEDHRWVVTVNRSRGYKDVIMTTKELVEGGLYAPGSTPQRNKRVRIAGPLDLPEVELPIDPYVFGVWLGDGTSENGGVTNNDPEVWAEVERRGYTYSEPHGSRGTSAPRTIYNIRGVLDRMGVLGNKHIPEQYLRASYSQRLDLMRGLMDTDGSYNKTRKRFSTCTTREWHAEGFRELALSLGWKCKIQPYTATWSHLGVKKQKRAYSIEFSPPNGINPFLVRDQTEHHNTQDKRSTWRVITSIEPTPEIVPTQCITVDSPSETYLCTRSMIPTHNTSKGTYWSHEMQVASLARAEFMLIEGEDGFWEEVDIPRIDQFGILHLRPDYYDPLKDTWTEAFYNWILIDPDEIDMHYTAFCGLRDVANMQYAIKQHRKAKEKEATT